MQGDQNPSGQPGVDPVGVIFGSLTGMLSVRGGIQGNADRLVQVAAQLMPHAHHAAATVIRADRRPVTTASTSEVPRRVDALQYENAEGPCLEASTSDDVVLSDDLSEENRWPAFAAACVREIGIRSMLSVRLALVGEDRAALNFYSADTAAFKDEDVNVGAVLAPFAALVIQQQLHKWDVASYREALSTSRQIGTAIGILMSRHQVTVEEAFGMLRTTSSHLNRKLRDIAVDVTYTGELPRH